MKKCFILAITILLFASGCSNSDSALILDDRGYAIEVTDEYNSNQSKEAKVRNIILIIGDGMGENQVEVAKMLLLKEGENFDLDKAEYRSEIITSCLNNYVTDSGAAATAYATGIKTNYETIGKDKDGKDLKTILDYAYEAGYKTGLITDKDLGDATPAAFSVHLDNRYLMTETIPLQQISSNIDILIGGGSENYVDYTEQILEKGYDYITTKEGLLNSSSNKIFATYSSGRLMNRSSIVPTLAEMTNKAISVLKKNKQGFLLVVEAGQIDNHCGEGDVLEMAKSVQDLDKTLRVALNFMRENPETMVVVLADHETGGLVIREGEPNIEWFTEETRYHTAVNVPLYAFGDRSSVFNNKIIDNTEVFYILMETLGLM